MAFVLGVAPDDTPAVYTTHKDLWDGDAKVTNRISNREN